jgi:hypothetical protein
MKTIQTERPPTRQRPPSDARSDAWEHSDTLFFLTCYDVWSATPPRGCLCGDVVLAIDRP